MGGTRCCKQRGRAQCLSQCGVPSDDTLRRMFLDTYWAGGILSCPDGLTTGHACEWGPHLQVCCKCRVLVPTERQMEMEPIVRGCVQCARRDWPLVTWCFTENEKSGSLKLYITVRTSHRPSGCPETLHSARDCWRLKEPAGARIACSKVAFLTEQRMQCTKCNFSNSNLIFKTSLNFEHL